MSGHITSKFEQRVITTHSLAHGLIRPIGVTAIPGAPLPLRTASGEWLFVAAEQDPHIIDGTFIVPEPVLERMRQLETAKVTFDRLFVAHEVPSGTLIKGPKEKLDSKALAGLIPRGSPDPRTSATLSSCTKIARAAAGLLLAPITAAGALPVVAASAMGAVLDPALFGVITPSGKGNSGEIGAWFLIAAWT